ncbi:hypothetical protein FVR03_09345 [Pontibacter qinzhouensis]|uniref:IPT/TIG domain-containing protein n=1 Tax=Pontibacter qinzhouensis TaxID=2603253 RepID=A0A5C8K968_9BACT|nr:IPT/TIG domain-containing protein [Pontibacter qinzhouensis]TXK47586.1 hypothetical protein FVR03_09345 [Pontibacter qinzhouensis]
MNRIFYLCLLCCLSLLSWSCEKDREQQQIIIESINPGETLLGSSKLNSCMIGDTLTIYGHHFSFIPSGNQVTIHGIPAIVVTASGNELKVVVPEGIPFAYVDLLVARRNYLAALRTISINEYPSPEITGVRPTSGSAGTVVTIYGKQLDKAIQANQIIAFTDVMGEMLPKIAYPLLVASADSIQLTIPSDAGSGPVYLPVKPNQSVENNFIFLRSPVFTVVP